MYMRHYTFKARLAVLLGVDVVLTIVDSYIPHDLTPIRFGAALIQLAFMVVTMAVTMRRVLEDY
jgi:hypothetical protein